MTDRMSSCGKRGSVTLSGEERLEPRTKTKGTCHSTLALEEALAEELTLFRELVVVLLEALLRRPRRVGFQDAVAAHDAVCECLSDPFAAHFWVMLSTRG